MSELHIQTMRSNLYKKATNMNLDAVAGAEGDVEPFTPPVPQTGSLMTEANSTEDSSSTFGDTMMNSAGRFKSRCDTSTPFTPMPRTYSGPSALILSNQVHYN